MKKLFLSLSILTIAFSAQATFNNTNRMVKPYVPNFVLGLQDGLVAVAPAIVKCEALYKNPVSSATRLASNAKVAVVAAPAAVVAGGLYALDRAQAAQQAAQVAEQAALNSQAEKLAKAKMIGKMIGAEMAEQKANIEAGIALQSKGFRRVKNAISNFGSSVANTRVAQSLVNAGSTVKTQVLAHPRIATGAGLATVAGLSYLAYTKYGKATPKTVKPVVKASAPKVVTPVAAPKKAKKAHRRSVRGYGRRK